MGSFRALALALILLPVAAAHAEPTAKQKKQAGDLVKKAIAKSQAGDHETAVELYQEAYKIIPQPLLLSNIGSEYQQMDKQVEALKFFCQYLEADPTGSNVTYATAQAKTLYIELGGIATVEDADVCKPIVKPEPAPVAPAPPPEPDPQPPPPPPPSANDDAPKASPLRYVGIGVAVVGAGVFGLGVKYGLDAKKISDDISNHPIDQPWEGDIKAREAEGESAEKKQIGFMIGGGVALAAGVAMFFIGGPSKSSAETVSITPVATPDSVGFAAAGRF